LFCRQQRCWKNQCIRSIYFLSFGKSYFNNNIKQIVRFEENAFSIKGIFDFEGKQETIHISYQVDKKKIIKRNNKAYDRLADHIGLIPLVMISPYDRDLISERGETRRRFIDRIISQADANYLNSLIAYQKILTQRNRLLKYFTSNHKFDLSTLEIYDEQLDQYASVIYGKRKNFIIEFSVYLQEKYAVLSGNKDK